MQPPQANAVASQPKVHYSAADLQILHEIISLATVFPGKNSFRALYRAYDIVLAARGINPAFDSIYFRFILSLQGVPGSSVYARFTTLLTQAGFDPTSAPPAPPPEELTRQRYSTARRRRDRSSHGTTDDEHYSSSGRDGRGGRERRSFGGLASSPTHEAIIAAELAARVRKEEVARKGRERGRRRARSRSLLPTTDEDEGNNEDGGEVEEIQRPRVPEDAADALYALRMKAVLRNFFGYWHRRTVARVEQKWFALVEQRAERRYNTILMAKAWSIWVHKTATIVQRTQEVRQRILLRKYFTAWRTIVVSNEAKIRLFRMSTILDKWRIATRKRLQVAAVAERVYRENLVHRAYWTWFFQLCGILGIRRYEKALLEQAWDGWVEKTEKVIQLNRMAAAFYRRHTLQTVFNLWSEKTLHCLDAADIAMDHAEWKTTEKAFDHWRRQTKFAPLTELMTEYANDRIAVSHLTLWRQRTQQSLAASAHYKITLLKTTLRSWRLHLRSKILTEQHLDKLEASTLRTWVLNTRQRQFTAWRDSNIARKYFSHWVRHYGTLTRRLERTGLEVVISSNVRLAKSVIDFMHTRLAFRQELMDTATQFHDTNVLTATLVRWRLKADLVRMYNDWADDALYYFTVRRTIRTWKRAFKASQRNKLRAAFHTVSRRTKSTLASSAFSTWLSRTRHVLELQSEARDFARERTEELAITQLTLWRDRTDALYDHHITAENFNTTRLLRLALTTWRERLLYLDEMHARADLLLIAHNTALAARYFEVWSAAAWRLKLLYLSCQRFERKRYKNFLRTWKHAALDRRISRASSRQSVSTSSEHGVLDETLDTEFGEEWVRPLPPQDLGRSLFGTSIRGQTLSLRRSVGVGTPIATPGWKSRRARVANTPLTLSLETPRRGFGSFGGSFGASGSGLGISTGPRTPRRGETPGGSPLMRFSTRPRGLSGLKEEFE